MRKREPLVLFFTAGLKATPEEEQQIDQFVNAKVRNGSIKVTGNLEEAFAVAGAAPKDYRERYPYVTSAAEVLQIMQGKGVDPAPASEAPTTAPAEEPTPEPTQARRGRKPSAKKAAAKTQPKSTKKPWE
jgi:hypothetical protein